MKAVVRELAQARRHYSRLPLFEFLRTDSIPPRNRLAFYPCMAPFVQACADLNRFVLRDETSNDPHQRLLNEHSREIERHWDWYLEDFSKLGFDRTACVSQVLRSHGREDTHHNRMLGARLAQLLFATTPIEKVVVAESIEQATNVLLELTAQLAARIQAEGGPELRYLGQFHFARATDLAMRGYGARVLETVTLTDLERMRCLDLAFRVFDMFADWSNELLAYAKCALARRTVPHVVHSNLARMSAP